MSKDDFKRIRLDVYPMSDKERFKLSLKFRHLTIDNDGRVHVWIDRGEVSNLQFDCSVALQEDDLAETA